MPNRLEPINVIDATGGLNLRAGQFQLAENESPELENITVDPLGGVYTRPGWDLWNSVPLPVDAVTWDPRRAFMQGLSDGTDLAYIAGEGKVWMTSGTREFTLSPIVCAGRTHQADFAGYADDTYIACGRDLAPWRRRGVADPVALTASGAGNWNDDYVNPVHDKMPKAELVEAHAGYLFVANLDENGTDYPNRVRWSHPTSPDDWAELDYIDIDSGGARITALMSYEDHLLIFKENSIWALYGYDSESWQLIQKSATIGAPGPQSVTRSEAAVFFFSSSDRGGVYGYDGERASEIATQLRRALEAVTATHLVWVGWMGRKLWVTLPWTYAGPTLDNSAVFVFDPSVGEGCWTYYTSRAGSLGPLVAGSNIDTQARPLGVMRATEFPCIVALDALPSMASDSVADYSVIGADAQAQAQFDLSVILTNTGAAILADGAPGLHPFPTMFRSPWMTAGWPTRRKSFRRPDLVCRRTGLHHQLHVQSFRDYEDSNPRRTSIVDIDSGTGVYWGEFEWGDGSTWGASRTGGSSIRRGSSFGICRALQLRLVGLTPGARWGIDAIVLKYVLRRFR